MTSRNFLFGCVLVLNLLGGSLALLSEEPPRRVFVPLEDLDAVLERDQRGVLMPRAQFQELYDLAQKSTVAGAPAGAFLQAADYTARIEDDQLLITAKLTITQLSAGWHAIPLPFEGLHVERAMFGETPAQIGREATPGRALYLLHNQTGKHELTLELSRPLETAGSDRLVAFQIVPIPVAMFRLTVPAGKFLQMDDLQLDRPAPPEEAAVYEIAVGGRKQIALRLTDRQQTQAGDGLVFATTAIGVNVSPEELTWQASTTVQVFGQPINRLEFNIPDALQIVSIASPGLQSWEFGPQEEGAGRIVLILTYRQAFAAARKITFQGVVATPTGAPLDVPTLRLADAASHTGRIIVTHPAALRLRVAEMVGVSRLTADDERAAVPVDLPVPPQNAAQTTLQFAAWREDFTLTLSVEPKAREIRAGVRTDLFLTSRGLDLNTNFLIQTRFAPLFEVGITIPAEWTVTSITVPGRILSWNVVPRAAGLNEIRIPLDPPVPVGGELPLLLTAHRDPEDWPIDEEPVTLALPEVQLTQASLVEGTLAIIAEGDLKVSPIDFTGLEPARLDGGEQLAALGIDGGFSRLGYEYQDGQFRGQLRVERKPTRLSASLLTFTRLDREVLQTHLEAVLQVEGGGVEQIEVTLPESVGTALRFALVQSPLLIVEQTAGEPVDGRRPWILQFDQRARGFVRLTVDIAVPRGTLAKFTVPDLRIPAAERVNGQIAIEAAPEQRLDITALDAAGQPLPEIDPLDLLPPAGYTPRERLVATYAYYLPGPSIQFAETRFDRSAVPTAIASRLDLTTILEKTGELQHQADWKFRAVGVQSLLLTLPEDARLWSVQIDSKPIEVRRQEGAYLIPLPPAAEPGAEQCLLVIYSNTTAPLKAAGRLVQVPPRLDVLDGQGARQPLEVLTQNWSVYHPDGTEFVGHDQFFSPVEPPHLFGFLGRWQQSLEVDTPEHLLQKLIPIVITVLVVWIIAAIFRRWGIIGLLTAAVSVVFGVMMIGMALLVLTQPLGCSESRSVATKSADVYHYSSGEAGYTTTESSPAPAAAAPMMPGMPPTYDDAPASRDFSAALDEARRSPEEAAPNGQPDLTVQQPVLTMPIPAPAAEATPSDEGAPGEEMPSKGEPGEGKPSAGKPSGGKKEDFDGDRERQPADDPFAPPQEPPPQQAAPRPTVPSPARVLNPAAAGGLLSLTLDFSPPPNSRRTQYQYSGTGRAAASPQLDVRYQNRERLSFTMICLAVGVILLFWWFRNSPRFLRGLFVLIGLGLPLALAPLAPPRLLPYLDGLLLGTLAAVALWAIQWLARPQSWRELWATLRTRVAVWFAIAALGLAFSGTPCFAQQEAPNAGPAAVDQMPPPMPARDSIIIPYDPTTDPLQAERIFLPFDVFLKLWNQAHPDQQIAAPAPVDGLIAEALYSAQLQPAAAGKTPRVLVTARIVAYSFRETQIRLALPLGTVALDSATLDGAAAPLVPREENGTVVTDLLLSTPGAHVLDLKFSVPVNAQGAAGRFTLPLQPVPAGALRFELPAPDLTVRVTGASGAYRRLKQEEVTLAVIPINAGGDVTVSWQPAQERAAVDGIIQVESATAVRIDDAGIRFSSAFTYRVRQGSLSEVVVSLPPELAVREIQGPDVGGWEIVGEGAERTLRVILRRKVEDATTVSFDLYLATPLLEAATNIKLPDFGPVGVTRETGQIGVFPASQFAVRVGSISSLTQIEPQNFAITLPKDQPTVPPQLAFHFVNRPLQLELQVSRRKPRVIATAEHTAVIEPRKTSITSRLKFTLSGAPRSELTVQLPPGYLLLDVSNAHLADWYQTGRDEAAEMAEAGTLHLELTTSQTGYVEVLLVGKLTRGADDVAALIAVPSPSGVDELRSELAVQLDPVYRGSFDAPTDWKSVNPDQLSEGLRSSLPTVHFGFTSTSLTPAPLEIDLSQGRPRLNANSLTILTVEEALLDYTIALQWNITLAGADTFIFTAPQWLQGRLEFQDFSEFGGAPLRSVTESAAGPGRIRWTIVTEQPRRGTFFLVARATLPPPPDTFAHAPSILFEQATEGGDPVALETQNQYVVLVNQAHRQLSPRNPDAVEAIPAEELTKVIRLQTDLIDQAAEIVRIKDPAADVSWQGRSFESQKMLPASVNLADLTTVIATDGTWRTVVRYRVRNRSRQFLAVQLPADSLVLSVFVREQPSRLVQMDRKGQTLHLIPLPKTIDGDLPFVIQLVLAGRLSSGPLPIGPRLPLHQIDVPSPNVISQTEDAEYGIPVAKTTWTVYLPREYDAHLIEGGPHTNVSLATETLQQYEQEASFLTEVSELIDVNKDSTNYRAQINSWNNLKQLKLSLSDLASSTRYAQPQSTEELNRQGLNQQRAQELQKAVTDLERRNSAITTESASQLDNEIVQQYKGQSERGEQARQLFLDNGGEGVNSDAGTVGTIVIDEAPGKDRQLLRGKVNEQTLGNYTQNQAAMPQSNFGRGNVSGNLPPRGSGLGGGSGVNDFSERFSRRGARNEAAFWEELDRLEYNALPSDHNAVDGAANGLMAGQPGNMVDGPGPGGFEGFGMAPAGESFWRSAGGLSVALDIPTDGTSLSFIKVGGNSKLRIGVRPHATLQSGLGALWSLACIVLGLAFLGALRRTTLPRAFARVLPSALILFGLLVFFLIPQNEPAAVLGFLMFLVGLLAFAIRRSWPQPARP